MCHANQNSTLNSTSDFFDGVFEKRLSKTFFELFAFIAIPTVVALSYSIIWYERYGQDAKRTIVNKIFSSLCWTSIEFTLLVCIPDLSRYLLGPLPEFLCWFHLIIKNGLFAKILLLQTGLIILRYACIFWLRNPAAFNDDFWSRFINIWVLKISYSSQFVFVYLPGQHPMSYYICVGENPKADLKQPLKFNISFYILLIICIVTHILMSLRIFIYKHQIKNKIDSQIFLQKYASLNNSQSFFGSSTITFSLVALAAFGILFSKIVHLDPQELNDFPNYLFVYWMHLVNAPLTCILLLLLCYARNEFMRKTMIRELKDFLRIQNVY